jgi:hypothetical protein
LSRKIKKKPRGKSKSSADQEIAKKSNNFKSIFKVIESSNKFSSIVHQIQCSAIKKIGEN